MNIKKKFADGFMCKCQCCWTNIEKHWFWAFDLGFRENYERFLFIKNRERKKNLFWSLSLSFHHHHHHHLIRWRGKNSQRPEAKDNFFACVTYLGFLGFLVPSIIWLYSEREREREREIFHRSNNNKEKWWS